MSAKDRNEGAPGKRPGVDESEGGGLDATAKPASTVRIKEERRCTATANRTGRRCNAPAIKGGTVCRMHGGALPQVKAKARERLAASSDSLMTGLLKIALTDDTPVYVRLQAIRDGLDRAGFGARHATPAGESDDPWADLLQGLGSDIDRSMSDYAPDDQEAYDQRDMVDDAITTEQQDQAEAWEPYYTAPGRIDPDDNTVQGEVIHDSPHPSRGGTSGNSDPDAYAARLRERLGDEG